MKKLARVVLDELYPRYVDALALLETTRTAAEVGPRGRQKKSFGATLKSLAESLPAESAGLLDCEANKIRNAFDHGHARWDPSLERVALCDENWTRELPVAELRDRLQRMLNAYMDAYIILMLRSGNWLVAVAHRTVTWDDLEKSRAAFEATMRAEFEAATSRAASWRPLS